MNAMACECKVSFAIPPTSALFKDEHNIPDHCKTCFELVAEEIKMANTNTEIHSRPGIKDVSLIVSLLSYFHNIDVPKCNTNCLTQEYKCDCGNLSRPAPLTICRLCLGVCKPLTLNKNNRIISKHFLVHSSLELFKAPTGASGTCDWMDAGEDWDS